MILLLLAACGAPTPSARPTSSASSQLPLAPAVPSAVSAYPSTLKADQLRQLARAKQLNDKAHELWEQGHYHDGLPLCEEALAIQERILGPWHPEVAFTLNYLASIHQQEGRAESARSAYERALAIREKAFGPESLEVAKSLNNLAEWRRERSDFAGARPLLLRALAIREHHFGKQHPAVAFSMTALARVEEQVGASARARTLYEGALYIQEHTPGVEGYDLGTTLNDLGGLHHRAGNFEEAKRYYDRALAVFQPMPGRGQDFLAITLTNLGTLRQHIGDLAGARRLYEQALRIHERLNGPSHPSVGTTLTGLSGVLRQIGDVDGAQRVAERAQTIYETAYGPNHPTVAVLASHQADLYRRLRQPEKATTAALRALTIRETVYGPTHPLVASTLTDLADLYASVSDHSAALKAALRARDIQTRAYGQHHPDIAATNSQLGHLYWQNKDFQKAETSFEEALAIREQTLGKHHPDIAIALSDLGQFRAARGELAAARDLYERARQIHLAVGRLNDDLDEISLRGLWRQGTQTLRDYAAVLATLSRSPKSTREALSAQEMGFMVAEQARSWIVQAALAKAIARAGTVDPTAAHVARQVQDLRQRRHSLWKALDALYGKPIDQRDPGAIAQLQQDMDATQSALDLAVTQLTVTFPQYADLAAPTPASSSTIQQALSTHEALVSFLSLGDRVLIWLVRPGATLVYLEAPISQPQLLGMIDRLKSSIPPPESSSNEAASPPPYDVATAFDLYSLLIKPLEPHLVHAKHLILVPDELLLAVPFAALLRNNDGVAFQRLTEVARAKRNPTPPEQALYAQLPWLIQSYTLTILPSASSLKILREPHKTTTAIQERFIGFGDPILGGTGTSRGGKMLLAGRGMRVARDEIQNLDRLPNTRTELLTVASVLGVEPTSHVFLGEQATETRVLELNQSGRLGRTAVLSFATHGLMAGQLQGLTQPALVLTPPDSPSDEDDGLLSLEEILRLQLPSTEWVVLSACNTAAGDGSGDGLSGLARAFFFAGAKRLLVSQWSVDDVATQSLMTEVFRRYGRLSKQAPADSLREAMLTVMQKAGEPGHAYFAHPYAWAPFVLVGDGALKNGP